MASSSTTSTRSLATPHATPVSLAWPLPQLILAAASIALLFAALHVAPAPLWAGQPAGRPPPPTPEQAALTIGWPGVAFTLVLILGAALPFRPYHLAQRAAHQAAGASASTWLVVCLTAGLALVASLIYPSGSDVFDYAGFERMWVVYGDNPLFALPQNRPEDWATALVWFADRTPAYGPLWALLTWPIVRLAGDSPTAIVAGYKILSIAAYAGCCWLIWSSVDAARRHAALVLFAWSPLVLFEVLGRVHNDSLPTLAMLALVWIAARRPTWATFGLAAVAAGSLVKVTALAAAPAALMYAWRRARWRAVIPAVLAAGLVVFACYLPFWDGPRSLASIWNQTSRLSWSPASLLILSTRAVSGLSDGRYDMLVRVLLGLACLASIAYLVRRGRFERPAEIAAVSGWITLASVLLLTGVVLGHYLVPAVAFAAVSEDTRLQRTVFWLSLGALAALNIDVLALTLGRAWLESDGYRLLGTLILLGPAAAAFLLSRDAPRPESHSAPS